MATLNFADLLKKINTGAQIAQALQPALQQYGTDHVGATQEILQIAGAGVAAESSDPTVQAEAQASAAAASQLVPLVFQIFSFFKHKPKAPVVTPPAQ